MQENTVNGLVQAIKLFAAIAGCIIIVLAFFWIILGTFVMQLLTMSAFITGVFLLGSWWNDYVQDKERQTSRQLISTIVQMLQLLKHPHHNSQCCKIPPQLFRRLTNNDYIHRRCCAALCGGNADSHNCDLQHSVSLWRNRAACTSCRATYRSGTRRLGCD